MLDGRDARRPLPQLVTPATNYEDKPNCLFSHDFNENSFVALAVELGVDNLLPGTKVEFPAGDRDNDFMVKDQRFQVRVSVVFFFSSRRRHTRLQGDWSSDVCSS